MSTTTVHLFHRRTRTAYLYNGCMALYNVLITSRVHSSVKSQFPRCINKIHRYGLMRRWNKLNHRLSWLKFVNTHLSHSSQWFNIHTSRPVSCVGYTDSHALMHTTCRLQWSQLAWPLVTRPCAKVFEIYDFY